MRERESLVSLELKAKFFFCFYRACAQFRGVVHWRVPGVAQGHPGAKCRGEQAPQQRRDEVAVVALAHAGVEERAVVVHYGDAAAAVLSKMKREKVCVSEREKV